MHDARQNVVFIKRHAVTSFEKVSAVTTRQSQAPGSNLLLAVELALSQRADVSETAMHS